MTIETTIVSMLVIFTITIIVLVCHIVAINKNKDEQLKKKVSVGVLSTHMYVLITSVSALIDSPGTLGAKELSDIFFVGMVLDSVMILILSMLILITGVKNEIKNNGG